MACNYGSIVNLQVQSLFMRKMLMRINQDASFIYTRADSLSCLACMEQREVKKNVNALVFIGNDAM